MPTMTRAHYNLIADATFAIIERIRAMHHVSSVTPLEGQIATLMTEAVAGTNSAFKADRFRERCLGIRGSR